MATVEITKDNIRSVIEQNGIVFIDWWASWCGPCRVFAPTYEAAASKYPDIVFGKINTEDQAELSAEFEIRSIPTIMIFRDRVLLFSQAGALPAAGLEDLISQVKALDMDQVRKEIARQQGAGKEELRS